MCCIRPHFALRTSHLALRTSQFATRHSFPIFAPPKFTFAMNIHEYQGKSILASYGVAVQRGYVASTPEEAHTAAVKLKEETGTGWFVVKA